MFRLSALLLMLAAPVLAATPDAGVKPRIAVLYFEPRTADPDMIIFAKGLAELMINDLLATDAVRVVERARLEEIISELKLGESRFADKSTFAKVGKILGTDYLVTGSLLSMGKGKYMLVPRMSVSESTEFVPLKNIPFDVDDVLAGEQQLVSDIAAVLTKRGVVGVVEPPKRNHKLPMGTGMKFAKALEAKDKKDKATQKQLLSEVVKEQPDFKLAQLDLLSLRD
jgi:TolB-like protein